MGGERSIGDRTAAAAGLMVAWRALTRTLGFLSTLALARLLIPADFGLVAMASAFAGAVDSLSQVRVEDVLLRRPGEDTRLHDAAFTLQFLRALLTGGIIAAGAPLAAAWFSEPRLQPVLLVLAGFSVVSGLGNIGPVEFRRTLRYDMQIRLMLVPRLLQVVSTVAAAWLMHSYWALLIGIGVTTVSRVVMSYVIHPYRPRLSLSGWREIAGFSFWLWAGSLGSLVWDRATTFIVGPAFGAVELGVFQVSQDVALLPVTELVGPASEVLLATLSLLERSGSRAADKALLVMAPLVMMVTPVVISLSAASGYVILLLLGPKWLPGTPLLAVLPWLCVLSVFNHGYSTLLVAQGRIRQRFTVISVASVCRTLAIYLGAQTQNLTWVAGGLLLSSAIQIALFMTWGTGRSLHIDRSAAAGLARLAVAGAVTVVATSQLGIAWQPAVYFTGAGVQPLQALLCSALIGGTVLGAFLASLCGLWWIVKKPEGPERMMLQLVWNVRDRVRWSAEGNVWSRLRVAGGHLLRRGP